MLIRLSRNSTLARLLLTSQASCSQAANDADKAARHYAKRAGKGVKAAAESGDISTTSTSGRREEAYDVRSMFHQSRFHYTYHHIIYRELLLKANPRKWHDLPRLDAVTLTIDVEADTRLGKDMAEKSELLLHLLALEHIGGEPAHFTAPPNKHYADKAGGVSVMLRGTRMYAFLEKLLYVVLPNQIGFEGASPPSTALDKEYGQLHHTRSVELKVTNLLLYPDFEANFDLFEPLRGMTVKVDVEGAESATLVNMLLSAFGMPVKPKVKGSGAAAEEPAAARKATRGVRT